MKSIKYYLVIALFFPSILYAMMPVIDVSALLQLGFQLEQLKKETEMLKQELQSFKQGDFNWSNAQSVINQLGDKVNQTNALAYSAGNMDQQFKQAYPGYKSPDNYNAQYQANTDMTLNTLDGVMQSIGTSAKDFSSENERLKFLQNKSQTSKGQLEAIQAATEMSSEMVSQQQLLRQVIIAQTNAQSAYYATQIQNEASSRAELHTIIQAGSTDIPKYGSSSSHLVFPNYK